MLKYLRGHPRPLRDHYDATSGLTQNALIELKIDMNDLFVNLRMLKYFGGIESQEGVIMKSLPIWYKKLQLI